MFRTAWPIAAVTGLLCVGGCSDENRHYDNGPPPGPRSFGTLDFHWTIDGAEDPAACDALGATEFQALISDGFAVSRLDAPCSDFTATATLYVDDYVTRARLSGEGGFSRTRRIVLDQVRILEDQVTSLSIDFPSELIALPEEAPEEVEPDAGLPLDQTETDAGVPPDEVPTDAAATDAGAT